MRSVVWNIALLWGAVSLAASGQVPNQCSAPSEYPHTRLAKRYSNKHTFNSGQKVYYNCLEDFTPHAGSRAVQCHNGKWSTLTLKCEKKSCGNAGDLPNGDFQYEGNSYLGEKVYAVCHAGYTLKGLNYMICKRTGWTGKFPTCEATKTTCSAPKVTNSVKSGNEVSAYRVGESAAFTCSPGFQLDGAQQIICGPAGQWEPEPPRCLPSHEEKSPPSPDKDGGSCGVPVTTSGSNANLADNYITRKSFASGETVQYICDVGHVAVGGSRYRRCSNGIWTALRLKCERKLCGSAGEIVSGQYLYTGVEFGDSATAVCDKGFNLVGRATRRCMSKGWDGHPPTCEAMDCGEPPQVANAEWRGQMQSSYKFRSTIHYHCQVGTLIGSMAVWCTENGTWSTLPQCKEITCPSPRVDNAFWMGPQNNLYQYRDILYMACNPGYIMTGPSTVTCENDGQWYPDLPKCERYGANWRY